MNTLTLSLATACLLVFPTVNALAEDVSTCGQTVSAGVLTTDLDCSASSNGVIVESGGTLDLAGYTLTGGLSAGVVCSGDCTIEGGGGSIVGGANWGVLQSILNRRATVTVSNLEISGNGLQGIEAQNVDVDNCTIVGNDGIGVKSARKTDVVNSEISQNLYAVSSGRNVGVYWTTMDGNDFGIHTSRRVILGHSTLTNFNGYGVRARKVLALLTTITGVGGNAYCVEYPLECVDVASAGRPRLYSVGCGTSANLDVLPGDNMEASGESWGVCTLD